MSSRTGRRRRTIPGYVSIEIASFRSIAASFKNDAEFGRWVKKAFDDMSIGCILDDTDPRIRAIYTEAFERMEYEYKRKKEWEERKNKENSENSETQARTEPERRPAATQQQPRKKDQPVDVPQPVPPKILNLAYSGEFGNVKLSQEQYNELGIKFGNQQALNRAIDSLSSKLENGEIQPVPKNHYAVLVKWAAYRDDKREEKDEDAERYRYETVSEHNARVLKQSTEFIMNGGLEKLKNGTIGTF